MGSAILAAALMVSASFTYSDLLDGVNIDKQPENRINEGDNTKILIVLRQHAAAFSVRRKRLLLVVFVLSGIASFLAFVMSAVMCFGSVI
ncbi:MAG TPA: hypothetical protein VFP71_01410 [Candidatus Angelobacter sp.]|nr:hypothetical protein [Candidatus Angelobacter sp.]